METKRKNLSIIAILSSLSAVILHSYLTYKYYGLKYGFSNSSLCNINQKFNCDVASTSSYADIFGVPVALLGALTNLMIIIFLFNTFISNKEAQRPYRYGYYLALFTFIVSIIMGVISTLFLTSFCPFCIATYVLSLITLVCYHISFNKQPRMAFVEDLSALFNENKSSLYMLLAIPLLGLFINWNIQKRFTGDRLDLFIQESLTSYKQRKEFNFKQDAGLTLGKDDAKFTIVEFADYLCPHCKSALTPLKTFLASHQDAKLIFKPYPLDGSCNPSLGPNTKGDGIRCRLAFSVYCAEKHFKMGWQLHEFIFENQEVFHGFSNQDETDKKVCELLKENCETVKTCAGSEEAANWVKLTSKEGSDAEVTGTPTVYVNGKKLDGGANLMVLKSLHKELNL